MDRLEVSSTPISGGSWDGFGGAPDPIVEVYVGNRSNLVASFDGPDNTFAISYSSAYVSRQKASDIIAYLGFRIIDEDITDHDFIGWCYYTRLGPSVWQEVQIVLHCERDSSTENSGFTLVWHLEADF
ncbi:MAG: hypothetical protein RMJ84_05240 [Sandaracinaceae bacterium]|nr:hypothetical protein [Sandaracinaceae bacterium]